MIPLFEITGKREQKILGFPMNQNRLAVPTWSYAMEQYPPKTIVEIGSYNGGFTLAIGLHAWNIGCQVHSWDVCRAPSEHWEGLAGFLGVHFYCGNVFDNETRIAEQISRPGITYLLCDGGNKPKEFDTFAKYLKPGDVIAAHDYCVDGYGFYWGWSEISREAVAETVKHYGLVPWMQPHFDCAAWLVYVRQ